MEGIGFDSPGRWEIEGILQRVGDGLQRPQGRGRHKRTAPDGPCARPRRTGRVLFRTGHHLGGGATTTFPYPAATPRPVTTGRGCFWQVDLGHDQAHLHRGVIGVLRDGGGLPRASEGRWAVAADRDAAAQRRFDPAASAAGQDAGAGWDALSGQARAAGLLRLAQSDLECDNRPRPFRGASR
jgi:hypothetical protein